MPNLLLVEDTEGNVTLYNLDQIVMVSEIRPGHCVITFAHNVVSHLQGDGADTLLAKLVAESQSVDGTPITEIAERFARQIKKSGPSRVIPFNGSEPQS